MEERGGADCILLVLVSQYRPIFQWSMRRSHLHRLSQVFCLAQRNTEHSSQIISLTAALPFLWPRLVRARSMVWAITWMDIYE